MKISKPIGLKPIRKFYGPLTAPQLFQPEASVFLDNLTYEDQLLGMMRKINDLIRSFNKQIEYTIHLKNALVNLDDEFNDYVGTMSGIIDEINQEIEALDTRLAPLEELPEKITNLMVKMQTLASGLTALRQEMIKRDADTLDVSLHYTDNEIADLDRKIQGELIEILKSAGPIYNPTKGTKTTVQQAVYDSYNWTRPNGIMAKDYDAQEFTAQVYDSKQIPAFTYDILMGYMFKPDMEVNLPKYIIGNDEAELALDLIKSNENVKIQVSYYDTENQSNSISELEIGLASNTLAGLMSPEDKQKLNGRTGGTNIYVYKTDELPYDNDKCWLSDSIVNEIGITAENIDKYIFIWQLGTAITDLTTIPEYNLCVVGAIGTSSYSRTLINYHPFFKRNALICVGGFSYIFSPIKPYDIPNPDLNPCVRLEINGQPPSSSQPPLYLGSLFSNGKVTIIKGN